MFHAYSRPSPVVTIIAVVTNWFSVHFCSCDAVRLLLQLLLQLLLLPRLHYSAALPAEALPLIELLCTRFSSFASVTEFFVWSALPLHFFVCPQHRFVRPLNKGKLLSSTLSCNIEQLPYTSQVFLLLGPWWTALPLKFALTLLDSQEPGQIKTLRSTYRWRTAVSSARSTGRSGEAMRSSYCRSRQCQSMRSASAWPPGSTLWPRTTYFLSSTRSKNKTKKSVNFKHLFKVTYWADSMELL